MKVKTIIGIGGAMMAIHFILREIRKNQPDIHYVENIPGNYNAVTIPPAGIFISQDQAGNEALLKHEMIHWQQYQRMGLGPYYFNYFKGLIEHGYDQHPMEQEARQNETPFVQVNYTEAVRKGIAKTIQNPNFRKAS